ncbi:MAG: hypothetical protein HRU38_25655 [Saccharospirillaceae bacterium]|nr:hypothetical protein [Saccharospirillaceae bacterium]
MELQNHFTIISEGNPSQFTANFTSPILLEEGYLLGIKNLFYGEINNVNSKNGMIYIQTDDSFINNAGGFFTSGGESIPIPITQRRYNSTGELLTEIKTRVSEYLVVKFPKMRLPTLNYSVTHDKWTIKLPTGVSFNRSISHPSVLDLLAMNDGLYNSFETRDAAFDNEKYVGFLYCSIIENSYINSRSSRLLATIPLSSTDGMSYHEYSVPNYYRISIRNFSDINFELRNEHGDIIEFSNDAKLILNLHLIKSGI